jgi:ABC-2 type transport system permease protein
MREIGATTVARDWTLTGTRARRRPWRKYVAAFRISLLSQLAYPGELWLRTLFLVLIMFIFSSLWHTTYGELGRATVGGFTLPRMLWYLAVTESLMLSRPRGTVRLDEEVRTGDFAYALARPYRFVLFRYAQASGERVVRLAVNLAVALPLAFLFTGAVALDPAGLLPGLALAIVAMALDYAMLMSVQLLAFWIEDTTSFQFIYDRLLMLLGGMMLPLSLFPGPLATVARALPFSSVIYGPAQMLVRFDGSEFVALAARQAIWLVIASVVAGVVFRLGTRRVSANGG